MTYALRGNEKVTRVLTISKLGIFEERKGVIALLLPREGFGTAFVKWLLKHFATCVAICFQIINFAEVMKNRSISPQIRSIINKTTMPVGEVFESNGVLLRCVERPFVEDWKEGCSGCFFAVNNVTCPKSQCHKFGRTDGKSVWFVEVSRE